MSIWLSKQLITGGHAQKLFLPLCAVNMTLRLVRHTHITYNPFFLFFFFHPFVYVLHLLSSLSLGEKTREKRETPMKHTKKRYKMLGNQQNQHKGGPVIYDRDIIYIYIYSSETALNYGLHDYTTLSLFKNQKNKTRNRVYANRNKGEAIYCRQFHHSSKYIKSWAKCRNQG
jgi:hypothetical protein